jgi:hypothetical protein
MLGRYHTDITRQAIGAKVGPRALKVILRTNLGQDNLVHQVGRDYFHFDNNQIQASYAYIETQRLAVFSSLSRGDAHAAWRAFGRMIHTVQDFYSHSDYIPRWLSRFNGETPPPPGEIDPVLAEILEDPGLHTGMINPLLEALAFLPPLRKFVLPHLPVNAHAHINHDGPHISAQFDYVFAASVKRTRLEFEKTISRLSPEHLSDFIDR